MERSEIRVRSLIAVHTVPDCAALHPGYEEPAPGAGEACAGPIRAHLAQVPVARADPVRYPAGKA
jgi:hypothetical protein